MPAAAVGLDEAEWGRVSLAIRLEHEFTHYFTLRVYGAMRNNALDELYCDYLGIVAGVGRFRADWLLRFLGLESYPRYREGGRLQNYLGTPPLSPAAFSVLQRLVSAAAGTLERLEAEWFAHPAGPMARGAVLMALTRLTLEDLADADGLDRLNRAIQDATLALADQNGEGR